MRFHVKRTISSFFMPTSADNSNSHTCMRWGTSELLCTIGQGRNERSNKIMSMSLVEILFSGNHLKRAPRAVHLLKQRLFDNVWTQTMKGLHIHAKLSSSSGKYLRRPFFKLSPCSFTVCNTSASRSLLDVTTKS
jgi:hypothetical protein